MSSNHDHIKNDPRWHAARQECFDRDDWTCTEPGCGATTDLQADHVVPLAVLFMGGVDEAAIEAALDVENLRTLCATHNNAKSDSTEAVVIRHTWVSTRFPILRWIEDETPQDDTPSEVPVF